MSSRGDPDPAQKIGAHEEARRVDGECYSWASGDDDRAPDRRAEHADDVPREALERVRLLEAVGADGLGNESHLGREHQPEPDAVRGLERDDRADATEPSEHARCGRRLSRPLDDARADEHEVPGRRSERTPPPTTTSAWTPWRTAKTMPSAVAEPISSTAKASAIPASRSPIVVIIVPVKSRRKSRSRSAPRRS